MLEAHLVERCGLGSSVSLERERPALIRIMLSALEGLPAPVTHHAAVAGTAAVDTGSAPPPVSVIERPRHVTIGEAVWFDGRDFPALTAGRPDGPGYECRACGVRVKRGRHLDPRLLCPACRLLDTGQ
jgi:hypothetical protein